VRLQHILLPAIALGGAATLLLPSVSEGYTTLGGSLSTGQRDVRLFNNFTNPGANDNVVPDSNFPGFDGAEMAVWKAVTEWASSLHGGTGNGDPHQPGGLGSGGANFDAAWGGNATSGGSTNQNVVSLGGTCGGGTLAFTETPISDGWRILFCAEWTWADGPGTAVSGIDIQGVACHEYGHALGLGHSSVNGATMFPSISGTGVPGRSIAADDIAGIQSIYGLASATKPFISSVTFNSGTVTINGQNFDTPTTDVWFTSLNPTGAAAFGMAIATAVPSTSTQIVLAVPGGAGSGDVLVKNAGTTGAFLSNAFPLDMGGGNPGCLPPTNFCIAAPNSATSGAFMGWSGTTSVAANDFVLTTTGLPPNKLCLYIYSDTQIAATPFGNGFRCINPIRRIYPSTTSDVFGNVTYPLDINAVPPSDPILSGDTESFMCWYRDPPAGGALFNGSDAIETHWCP
jgi:hypothetical protein